MNGTKIPPINGATMSYPDDWGNGYTLCPTCKHYFHKSGTMECICIQCASPDCDELVDPQEKTCNDCTTDSE